MRKIEVRPYDLTIPKWSYAVKNVWPRNTKNAKVAGNWHFPQKFRGILQDFFFFFVYKVVVELQIVQIARFAIVSHLPGSQYICILLK